MLFKKSKRQKLWKQREQNEQELDWLYAQRRHLLDLLKFQTDPELIGSTIETLAAVDETIASKHEEEREILKQWHQLF